MALEWEDISALNNGSTLTLRDKESAHPLWNHALVYVNRSHSVQYRYWQGAYGPTNATGDFTDFYDAPSIEEAKDLAHAAVIAERMNHGT